MLGATMDIAADMYGKGGEHHLFVGGLFDELVRVAKDLPTSYFYGRRFGFQVREVTFACCDRCAYSSPPPLSPHSTRNL